MLKFKKKRRKAVRNFPRGKLLSIKGQTDTDVPSNRELGPGCCGRNAVWPRNEAGLKEGAKRRIPGKLREEFWEKCKTHWRENGELKSGRWEYAGRVADFHGNFAELFVPGLRCIAANPAGRSPFPGRNSRRRTAKPSVTTKHFCLCGRLGNTQGQGKQNRCFTRNRLFMRRVHMSTKGATSEPDAQSSGDKKGGAAPGRFEDLCRARDVLEGHGRSSKCSDGRSTRD